MRKVLLALLLSGFSLFAADVTGVWAGEIQADGETHPAYLIFKQDGNSLTGSGGPNATEQSPMKNGKVDGEKLTFDVITEGGIIHVELTPDGANLKGTFEMKSDDGNHSGTVTLKRAG